MSAFKAIKHHRLLFNPLWYLEHLWRGILLFVSSFFGRNVSVHGKWISFMSIYKSISSSIKCKRVTRFGKRFRVRIFIRKNTKGSKAKSIMLVRIEIDIPILLQTSWRGLQEGRQQCIGRTKLVVRPSHPIHSKRLTKPWLLMQSIWIRWLHKWISSLWKWITHLIGLKSRRSHWRLERASLRHLHISVIIMQNGITVRR